MEQIAPPYFYPLLKLEKTKYHYILHKMLRGRDTTVFLYLAHLGQTWGKTVAP